MSNRNLQPLQFDHFVTPDKNYHIVTATHPEHGHVGELSWYNSGNEHDMPPGEINDITVEEQSGRTGESLRRRGIATAMYNHANANYEPKPIHSGTLTEPGKAWAKSVGGPAVNPRALGRLQ